MVHFILLVNVNSFYMLYNTYSTSIISLLSISSFTHSKKCVVAGDTSNKEGTAIPSEICCGGSKGISLT